MTSAETTETRESPGPDTAHGDVIDTDTPSPPAETPSETPPETGSSAQRGPVLWLAIALAVAAAVFAGWAALGWYQASNDDSLDLARTRDQVLIAAHGNIETLTSLDQSDAEAVDAGIAAWLDASTADLKDELAQINEQNKKDLVAAGNVATGRVVEAAVIDLSAGGDSASVIAAVEITLQPPDGEATVKRNRFTADLLKVDGDWKLSSLAPVPVVSP